MLTENIIVNENYKYVDNDINSILKFRLEEENLGIERGIFTHAPVAASEPKKLEEFLVAERKDHLQYCNRRLLVPYLIGANCDGHWVGIVITFENNNVVKIEYCDSLNTNIPEKLENELKSIYGHDVDIVEADKVIQQNDYASCGPCLIENLINTAKQNFENKPSLHKIRRHHIELMDRCDPDMKFYDAQKSMMNSPPESTPRDHMNMEIEEILRKIEDIDINEINSIKHYNRRYSPSVPYKAKDDCAFVINSIFHVPKYTSFDEELDDDSSAEELDDEFVQKIKKYNQTKLFPYTTKNKKGSRTPSKNTRINEDIDPEVTQCRKSTSSERLIKFIKLLSSTSIRASIALNRMKSVSKRKNISLSLEVYGEIDENILNVERFGFFWNCIWYESNTGKQVGFDTVQQFYRQLKKYDRNLAVKFIEEEEETFESDPKNIPYQRLREYAKDHDTTKQLVKELRESTPQANIYLSIVDSDTIDFNACFDAYLNIVKTCKQTPTVMTTGYEFPFDPEYGHSYQLLSHLDRMLRVRTTFHIPLGTYFPEPNMCILIPEGCETVPESFIDINRGNRLESPIIMNNIRNNRENPTYIFSEDNPVITKIPIRAFKKKKNNIVLSGVASLSQSDFEEIPKVTQTNFNARNWTKNLFINKAIKTKKTHDEYSIKGPIENEFVSIISKLEKEVKKSESDQLEKALCDRLPDDYCQLIQALDERRKWREDSQKYARKPEEEELINLIQSPPDSPEDAIDIDLKTLPREKLLMLSQRKVLKVMREIEQPSRNVLFNELIELDEEILEWIISFFDDPKFRDAFKRGDIDTYWIEVLKDILESNNEDFVEAISNYSVVNIIESFKEDPLHLGFMGSMDDVDSYAYEHSYDLDIVRFGMQHYGVDINYVIGETESEAASCELLGLLIECEGEDEDEREREQYEYEYESEYEDEPVMKIF